jgi:hypothetical protein
MMECGGYHCCGLLAINHEEDVDDDTPSSPSSSLNGTNVRCWSVSHTRFAVPVDEPFLRIWVGHTSVCGQLLDMRNDSIICWGDEDTHPPLSWNVSASSIVDLHCSDDWCVAVTTTSEEVIIWTSNSQQGVLPSVTINHYDHILAGIYHSGPSCGIITATGEWHCVTSDPFALSLANSMPPSNIPLRRLSYGRSSETAGDGAAIRLDGSIISFGTRDALKPVPPINHTFIEVCAQERIACGIRSGIRTIECWGTVPPAAPNADKPWTGGAVHNDYISLVCADYSSCAMRENGDAYCWGGWNGEVPQPPLRGPWLKLQGYDAAWDRYYGLWAGNNTIISWSFREGDQPELLNMSVPVIDFVRGREPDARICTIDMNSKLKCTQRSLLHPFPQQDAIFDIPLNRSHQLTASAHGGICVLVFGQLTCSGDVQRFRLGGHAMQPRQTLRRIIKIATIDDGAADRPFCGQKYFKACASVKYAMSMIESIGPWIEFQFAPGEYALSQAILIDYTGITFRGAPLDGDNVPQTIFRCSSSCITINAPSTRIINIKLYAPNAIVIHSGIMCSQPTRNIHQQQYNF